MRVRAGTSGFSYPEWKGTFYPADMKPAQMLGHYASQFSSVEINNTFYRMPAAAMLAGWGEQVPKDFVFALKASQRITHQRRLKDVADGVELFFRAADALGPKLGPTLFQLPPNMKKDLPRLVDFLATLPPERRAAFEFRHASWFEDDVFAELRTRKAALCIADAEELATPVTATADWGYLRLRRQDYTDAAIATWAERIRAQAWSEAFVFFKHEEEGKGPKLASELGRILAESSTGN